jgi:predicted Zn-dependent peptidase
MINKHTFDNGFRIVHENPQSKLPVTSIQLFCDYGSVNEIDGLHGAAHFIEHMCFKGTRKIPNGKEIFINYDKIGAYFNANTERRYTRYIIVCQDDYVNNCIYILSDMLMNSTFNKKEFEKERKVVVEENIRNEDNASDIIDVNMNKMLYNGSSYANEIDTLSFHTAKTLQYEDVFEMYKMFYVPNRMVLSIVSNISFQKINEALQRTYFMKTPKICNFNYNKYQKITTFSKQDKIEYNIQTKKGLTTLHVSIGFRTCPYNSEDKYILNLLSNIIGGTTSSRLFTMLRQDNGLTYRSHSYTTYYEHLGDLTIEIETDYHKILKDGNKKGIIPLIIGMLNDLIKKGVSQTELTNTKSNLKGSMALDLQSVETSTFHNGLCFLMENDPQIPYIDLYDKCYSSITKKQINQMIHTYFIKENMSVCLLGEHVPTIEKVKEECEKLCKK